MSLAFSRRSFLKYSAVAAVAVAGASLFSGCESQGDSYNLLQEGAGSMTILQVTATMGTYNETDKKYVAPEVTTSTPEITFPFKVENGRNNPIAINPNSFKVTVASKDGKTVKKYPVSLDGQLSDPNLKKDASASGTIKVSSLSGLEEEGTVLLTYCPDLQYNEYSLNWQLTVPAKKEESSGSTTTK